LQQEKEILRFTQNAGFKQIRKPENNDNLPTAGKPEAGNNQNNYNQSK